MSQSSELSCPVQHRCNGRYWGELTDVTDRQDVMTAVTERHAVLTDVDDRRQ